MSHDLSYFSGPRTSGAVEKKEVLETTKRGGVLVFTGQFYLQTGTTEALRHQQTENKWFRNIPERSGI